jgi:hypothetical protein
MVNSWLSIPKVNMSSKFSQLFHGKKTVILNSLRNVWRNYVQLTAKQRTAEWFTLHSFHLAATMASKLLRQMNDVNPIPESNPDAEDVEILWSLLSSWFSRAWATEPMVVGASNEEAVLQLFAKKEYVADIYEC